MGRDTSTGNDRYSGDRYSGIDRFSGTKTSDDHAILFTANNYFSGNDRHSGTKSPDRFFHYNGRCLDPGESSLQIGENLRHQTSHSQT